MNYDDNELNKIRKAEGLEQKIIEQHEQYQKHREEFAISVKEYAEVAGKEKASQLVDKIEKEFVNTFRQM